jgi:uncharacterized protein YdhG (YjbR/CyaY superfamily)
MAKSKSIVDQKLLALAEPQQTVMLKQAQIIRNLIPGATECISYNLPSFEVQGGVICGIEGYKKHNSYFPFSGSVLDELERELKNYERTRGSLHFPIDKTLPIGLLKKLIRVRLDQIELKSRKSSGLNLSYYDSAHLKSRGKVQNGEMHGLWEFWRKDGTLMRTGEFKIGIQVGTWWTHDSSGAKYKATQFNP